MELELFQPQSLEEACRILASREGARPLAGGTDIIAGRERGIPMPPVLVCLDSLGLDEIREEASGGLRIGSLVTHARLARSQYVQSFYTALAEACVSLGSPQVRNMGSLGGNLANASPAADAATALLALGANLEIAGPEGGRTLPIEKFFLGPEQTILEKGEIITAIILPAPAPRSAYLKLGRRKASEIAVVGVAAALEMDGRLVKSCRIGLAAVAPAAMRAMQAEASLTGRELNKETLDNAAGIAAAECSPLDDHRASAEYRREMVKVLFRRAVLAAAGKGEATSRPVLPLGGPGGSKRPAAGKRERPDIPGSLILRVNGTSHSVNTAADRLLVDVLREDLGLTGSKKSCGEGECGACTVLLDGLPVDSCLILAATAGGKEITTVEGLASSRELSPLQSAFVREGAVQCGFCTSGMLMSGSALLKRNPLAGEQEIKEALSGNLCRCTGYVKIVKAVQKAATMAPESE